MGRESEKHLLVAFVVGDLEVAELGLHVVVLLRDPSKFFGQLFVSLLIASIGLLVSLLTVELHYC